MEAFEEKCTMNISTWFTSLFGENKSIFSLIHGRNSPKLLIKVSSVYSVISKKTFFFFLFFSFKLQNILSAKKESNIRHYNFRPAATLAFVMLRVPPPWILKRGWLESSGWIPISSIGKTKGIALFFRQQIIIKIKKINFFEKSDFWDFLGFFQFSDF